MLVFEHDAQRDVLRLVTRRLGLRNRKLQIFGAADLEGSVPPESTAPLRIKLLSRSRDRVGMLAASARSSRQPAWAGSRRTSIV
jgi:hypothetical protein